MGGSLPEWDLSVAAAVLSNSAAASLVRPFPQARVSSSASFCPFTAFFPQRALCLQPLPVPYSPLLPSFPKGAPRTPDWLLVQTLFKAVLPAEHTPRGAGKHVRELHWALRSLHPGPVAGAQCHMLFQPTKTCSLTESVKWGRGHGLPSQTQPTA